MRISLPFPSSPLTFPVHQTVSQIANDYGKTGLKPCPTESRIEEQLFRTSRRKRQLLFFKCLPLEAPPHPLPFICFWEEDLAGSCRDLARCRATNHFWRSCSRLRYFFNFTRNVQGVLNLFLELRTYQWHGSAEVLEMIFIKLL